MFIYSTYFASLRRFIYYSLRVYSLLNFKYCLFCVYIYLCDFAKRCPLSQCSRNKTRGLAVLLGVNWEPRPRPIRGSVASLFCVKTRGVGRGDFVTLVRVLCPKALQGQRIFLWPRRAKSMRWLIITTLLAELGGSDWLVISFMAGEGESWLLGVDRLETQYRHLVWNPDRYIYSLETVIGYCASLFK